MLIHEMLNLIANPVSTLAAVSMFAFVPVVGLLMVATVLSDRVAH
ncbi:hypothetical protein GGR01_001920 [Acetobacter oeni]|nr:hypothetical protein [Acetobacter oeni]